VGAGQAPRRGRDRLARGFGESRSCIRDELVGRPATVSSERSSSRRWIAGVSVTLGARDDRGRFDRDRDRASPDVDSKPTRARVRYPSARVPHEPGPARLFTDRTNAVVVSPRAGLAPHRTVLTHGAHTREAREQRCFASATRTGTSFAIDACARLDVRRAHSRCFASPQRRPCHVVTVEK
jgi:hypothetical protein